MMKQPHQLGNPYTTALKQNKTTLMSSFQEGMQQAKKFSTDEKFQQLLAKMYVKGYEAACWEITEKAIKTLLDERRDRIGGGGQGG